MLTERDYCPVSPEKNMALDPYAVCPCGSGKKFKWCCQPIHEQIDKAYQQQTDGQHETALRTMDEIVRAHPDKPEAWGRKAHLLHLNGKSDEAERALEEAFKRDKNYAFGFLLQGTFRAAEGEGIGALMLYRKAVELYPPEAVDQRSLLFEQIGQLELQRNHAVAARYAMDHLTRYNTNDQEIVAAWDDLFGRKSRMPECAKREYRLQGMDPKRSPAWKNALDAARAGRLTEAHKAFEELAASPKPDPLAWYNLGVIGAWMGNNRAAVEALSKYVGTERDENKAVEAWALAEVLRLGDDLTDVADYLLHGVSIRFRDAKLVSMLLDDWQRAGRLVGAQVDQERGIMTALVLEEVSQLIGAAAAPLAPLGAYLTIVGPVMSVRHSNLETLAKIVAEIDQALSADIAEKRTSISPAQFGEVTIEVMLFPTYGQRAADIEERLRARASHFFEDVWTQRPAKALGGLSPQNAVGQPQLRRKVLGIILFMEQCLKGNLPRQTKDGQNEPLLIYDFDRVRRKLGLDVPAPPAPEPVLDCTNMSATDLGRLTLEDLSSDDIESAFRAAIKLDARDLAGKFVQALIARPMDNKKPDLFPFFKYLIDQAQTQAEWDRALRIAIEGEQADAERNAGRRRNDYDLRRGQLHAKRGDVDKSAEVFDGLIARVPGELKLRGSAAEAMLSLRNGSKARMYAEAGLDAARHAGNRDMEAYFQELVGAAKKQGG